MRIQETVRKPMTEAKYLNVDNTDRYRPIIRLFYLKYEKLKYLLYQEEVYEELKEDAYFREYAPEQCQQDLAALTVGGNLVTIQDTKKVATIEEFKNKKFRYQLSEATVEIERMVIRVENLFIESSSLEPTLLERLRINLSKFSEIAKADQEHIYAWWNDLNNDFMRLNQNYQDYMRELNSVKAEEMMKTTEFLVFKDRLIEYLRSFVKSLQVNAASIEQCLKNTDREVLKCLLAEVVQYELLIPRIDVEVKEGGIELLLTLLGVTDGTILKICEYNGEKCIAKELLHQKKKRATKRILQGMKGECCNNQYECRYRQEGKCLCGEEETKEILERFAERGIVKKFGSYYQYQI